MKKEDDEDASDWSKSQTLFLACASDSIVAGLKKKQQQNVIGGKKKIGVNKVVSD